VDQLRSRLQWGRDQLIAEILHLASRVGAMSVLQWGRDQLIAEMRSAAEIAASDARASMGPRSIDRGNA
jgi:hypothetical protein